MSDAWTINAGGRIYGPFSLERMRSFAGEGRLAANSLVAREGATDWREARTEAEFADLFSPAMSESRQSQSVQPQTPEEQHGRFAIVVDMKSRHSADF